jgi:3-methyladenine DNA glycosylase AlkD
MPASDSAALASILSELERREDPARAAILSRFFKTGPGEYGEGDRFRGIRVPVLRQLAKAHAALGRAEVEALLHAAWHEDRMVALLILMRQYARAGARERGGIFRFYLGNTRGINSWDLVDVSAPHIVGAHLLERPRGMLRRLAASPILWERRIAMVATFAFIRRGQFDDTLAIAHRLLADPEELIHKACGWMLREVGKRDRGALEAFLAANGRAMPRTMLRYAIERFPEALRRRCLSGG